MKKYYMISFLMLFLVTFPIVSFYDKNLGCDDNIINKINLNNELENSINGRTTIGTRITITSLIENDEFDTLYIYTADGYFTFYKLDLPKSINLNFMLDGFITYDKRIDLGNQSNEFIYNDLVPVRFTGKTLPNSRIVVTNLLDNNIAYINDSISSSGEFTIYELVDGQYTITIIANGFLPRTIPFEINRYHVHLNDIEDEYILDLSILSISGYALKGTRVELWQLGQKLASVVVGEGNRFVFNANENIHLHNGTYQLIAILETHETQRRDILITSNVSETYNFTQAQTDERVNITGVTSVRTTIFLYKDNKVITSFDTNDVGAFYFAELENGTFTLVFRRNRFEEYKRKVTISYGSYDVGTNFLHRAEPGNVQFGMTVQVILVAGLVTGLALILRNKKIKNNIQENR